MTLPLLPLVLDEVPPGLHVALAQEGLPTVHRRHSPRGGRFVLFDSRRGGIEPLLSEQTPIDVHQLRSGLPNDPLAALIDEGSARFQWKIGGIVVSEEVARVDKRALRRRLMMRLRSMIEAAGGAWLKLAAWPFPYRSAFNFRLDHDEFDQDDFDAVLEAASGHEAAFSHYVCASTHQHEQAALLRLRGSDVGSHGYWHHTYYDPQDNLKNIRRGIEALTQAGLEPSGFAAPHGRFNRGLAWALETLGVSHSSEFALAYDDFPFFPPGSSVLQIPVHPICLGIFLDAVGQVSNLSSGVEDLPCQVADAAAAHFGEMIETKCHAGEPIFLYGHPDRRLGRYPHVLRGTLQSAAAYCGLWRTDRTTIAHWWAQRAQLQFSVMREGDRFVVRTAESPVDFPPALEFWRGEHVAVLPLTSQIRFSPEALAYERRRMPNLPQPVRLDPPQKLKNRVRSYLDWEKVTPVSEISSGSLRGWLKKTLRRVRK